MNHTVILWVYVVLLIAGGLIGLIKAGSKASIIASTLFAIPIILGALGVLPEKVATGVIAFLLVYFGMRFAKGRKFMPAGFMTALSLVSLILLLAA